MSETAEAFEAIVGLIMGGIILLAVGGSLSTVSSINLTFWGIVAIVVGIVGALAVILAAIASLLE